MFIGLVIANTVTIVTNFIDRSTQQETSKRIQLSYESEDEFAMKESDFEFSIVILDLKQVLQESLGEFMITIDDGESDERVEDTMQTCSEEKSKEISESIDGRFQGLASGQLFKCF